MSEVIVFSCDEPEKDSTVLSKTLPHPAIRRNQPHRFIKVRL